MPEKQSIGITCGGRMKPAHLLATGLAVAIALIAVPNASARPAYLQTAIGQFKLSADKTGCQYCHTNAFGGEGWNKFGDAIRASLRGAAQSNVNQALYLVLKANKDSDGDGYADALEVYAKTLPGDPSSKPTKSVAVLQQEFKAKGGVDQYKPKP